MNEPIPAYGLWSLVVLNSAIFILFAMSFFKPRTKLDWRSLGAFSAFVVALFTEMYGFPLTIYLLSGWLQARFPGTDLLSHENGHLWHTLLGLKGNPHFSLLHLLSNVMVLAGFVLIASSWKVLHLAQLEGHLATTGPYAYVRHPQYSGFLLIMTGFLLMWPTALTLVMFPILVAVYARLGKREEESVEVEFGPAYRRYREHTPAFLPRLGGSAHNDGYAQNQH